VETNQCKRSLSQESFSKVVVEIEKPRIVESAKREGDTFANGGHAADVRPSGKEAARRQIVIPNWLEEDGTRASKNAKPATGQQMAPGTTRASMHKSFSEALAGGL
jgi:hypothetical protein